MGRLHALILAGAVALGGTQVAFAADFLPPAPRMDMPLRGTIVDNSGFYIRGDAGVAINTFGAGSSTIINNGAIVDQNAVLLQYDTKTVAIGSIFGLGFGYQFNNWFRADVTGEWHGSDKWTSRESFETTTLCGNNTYRCSDLYQANVSHSVFLANGYVDLGTWGGLTPYLGFGLGTAYNYVGKIGDTNGTALLASNNITYSASSAHKWNLAWALMAGMSYDLTSSIKVDVGYRYVNMGKMDGSTVYCSCALSETQHFKFASHDIRVGLRYVFNSDAPAPVQQMQPLVRKY